MDAAAAAAAAAVAAADAALHSALGPAPKGGWRGASGPPPPPPPPPPTSPPGFLTAALDVQAVIGEGTYGVVYVARTRKHPPRTVAVKLTKEAGAGGGLGVPSSAIRELAVLQAPSHLLPRHPNLVALEGVLTCARPRSLALIFEYAEHDLGGLVAHHRAAARPPLHPHTLKSVAWQLLRGLAHLHAHGFVHRDVKPANVLVTSGGGLRLADFGLARSLASPAAPLGAATGGGAVATLNFRAPELLLGAAHYGAAVDAWAAGCVVAELLLLRPLFPGVEAQPAARAVQKGQCRAIWDVLGPPDLAAWPAGGALPHWAADAEGLRGVAEQTGAGTDGGSGLPPPGRERLVAVLRSGAAAAGGGSLPPGVPLSPALADLLTRLLDPTPTTRLAAGAALGHPYFTSEAPAPGEDAFVCGGRRVASYPPRPRWPVER